jgi:hypothetical protein
VNRRSRIRRVTEIVRMAVATVGRAAAGRFACSPRLGERVVREGRGAATRDGIRGHRHADFAWSGGSSPHDFEECGTCGDA